MVSEGVRVGELGLDGRQEDWDGRHMPNLSPSWNPNQIVPASYIGYVLSCREVLLVTAWCFSSFHKMPNSLVAPPHLLFFDGVSQKLKQFVQLFKDSDPICNFQSVRNTVSLMSFPLSNPCIFCRILLLNTTVTHH